MAAQGGDDHALRNIHCLLCRQLRGGFVAGGDASAVSLGYAQVRHDRLYHRRHGGAHELSRVSHSGKPGLARSTLSNWYHWCLVAAWVLAAIYLVLALLRPTNPIGLFLLPLVLGLIGLAQMFPRSQTFPQQDAFLAWSLIHGLALLLGTVAVLLGFAAGVMYLVHSYRLKQKLPPRLGFRLPSLEWLQEVSEGSLIVSSFFLAGGLLAGIVLNLVQHGYREDALPWTDPVVLTSGVLLLWLVSVLLFNAFYRPARQGRKVAYVTFASLVFLLMVLSLVVLGQTRHAGGIQPLEARNIPPRIRGLVVPPAQAPPGDQR